MSLLDMRALNARVILGWALVKHVIARRFIGRRSPERWLARLEEESLAAVPPGAWDLLEQTSRCVGCGICDAAGGPGEWPSQWILGIARRPEDAPLAAEQLERLEQLSDAIEAVCPARLPVKALVKLVRDNAGMLDSP